MYAVLPLSDVDIGTAFRRRRTANYRRPVFENTYFTFFFFKIQKARFYVF